MTPRQQRFVEEYLIDLNATQAAIRAGYAADSADVEGCRQLANAKVGAAIAAAKAKRSERTGIDAAWLLTRLAEEAEADLSDLYGDTGELRPISEWPVIWRKGLVGGIKAIEERDERGNVTGIVREVKLSDRVKRLELIGKHVDVQAFKDRVEHSGAIGITITPDDAAL